MSARRRIVWGVTAALGGAAIGVVAIAAAFAAPDPADEGGAAASLGADPPAKEERYADTPKELEPFGRFVKEPYKRFFLEPLEALGPGRDVPEPDVETVKIGLLAPIERTHEEYIGKPISEGVRLAIEDANAAGGYEGKPFELLVRNDNGLWGSSASEIVRFAYDDACWGIIGSVDSANTHIAIRVALKIEIPIITPGDTDPTFSETNIPWAFRNIPDDRQMAYTIVFYVFRELGLDRVAIVRTNNRYGRFGVGEFRAGSVRFRKPAPIEINYEVHFENVNPDLTLQMDRLEETKPEGVVLWADAVAAGHIVKAMRARGLTMPVFACDRAVHPNFVRVAGPAAEGVVGAYPFDPDRGDPAYDDFAKRYEERTGTKPTSYAAYGYDAAMMYVQAIRKAGLNRFRIRDALQEMRNFKGITGEARFDHSLSNRAPVVLATVKDGRFVFDEPKVKKAW
ncbi:MAG: ABC transporter substrate-binding protein [Planctomycetes bacterium]|nr:ABC transporter substrate-binding protein [Planctomycetota bacterium]